MVLPLKTEASRQGKQEAERCTMEYSVELLTAILDGRRVQSHRVSNGVQGADRGEDGGGSNSTESPDATSTLVPKHCFPGSVPPVAGQFVFNTEGSFNSLVQSSMAFIF